MRERECQFIKALLGVFWLVWDMIASIFTSYEV